MRSVKMPDALSDVYRDMRDRRLLVPAIALIVAALAIPILLKSDPPAPLPPPPTDAAAGKATAAEAAVLTEQTGIRDYRKRLAALKQRNPFDSRFSLPEPKRGGGVDPAAEVASPPATTETAAPAGTDAGTSVSDAGTSSAPEPTAEEPSAPVSDDVTEPTAPDTDSDEDDVKPEIRFYTGRVDISLGPLGAGRTYEGVRVLDFLPDDGAPVVSFVGLASGADSAVFSVSSDVFGTSGEGTCAPHKPLQCQYLTLKVGEERLLKYEPNGKTYRLKLLETHVVRVRDPRED